MLEKFSAYNYIELIVSFWKSKPLHTRELEKGRYVKIYGSSRSLYTIRAEWKSNWSRSFSARSRVHSAEQSMNNSQVTLRHQTNCNRIYFYIFMSVNMDCVTPKPLGLNEFNVIYNNQYKILLEITLEYHKYTRMYKIEDILCMVTKWYTVLQLNLSIFYQV